ncbi:RNA polymerase sigma factor [Longispora albida]|uniref:RNA polymerase sigma factor n=1 Tax=Longispora albida TaxID=203523 RepID=UPI001FDF68C3|nr:sigma-70 family RNA polymerase sigma factor [Longispora albida]
MTHAHARDGTQAEEGMDHGFAELYRANFRELSAQLYVYLGDLPEAQDAVQEAFCRAWVRWGRISRYDDPVTWVRRVAWNLATSRFRRLVTARRYAHLHREEPHAGPGPERVALMTAMAGIPANHRKALVLHYLAGLPVAEIAEACRVREGTVKTWLYRGRAALAERLRGDEKGVSA